jgi:hypothetical protein
MNSEIMQIEFTVGDIDGIVKSLTTLSVLVESSKSKEDRRIALSKFDVGVAMLQAADPDNPMLKFFREKQTSWIEKTKSKNDNITAIVVVIVCMVVIIGCIFLSKYLGWLDDDPVGDAFKRLMNKVAPE